MDKFTSLYFETINPLTPYNRLCSMDVLFSIFLHILIYISFIKIIDCIFKFKIPFNTYQKIVYFLILLMMFGYVGRLARSKSLYKTTQKNLEKTIDIMNNAYFTYYFIA